MKQRYFGSFAEKIGYWNPDTEGSDDSFRHNEGGFAASVKIAHKAEQKCGQQRINGIAFQIICSSRDYHSIIGKDAGQKLPVEKGQIAKHKPD